MDTDTHRNLCNRGGGTLAGLLILALAACGAPPDDEELGEIATAVTCPAPTTLYLNFDGAMLSGAATISADDARTNLSGQTVTAWVGPSAHVTVPAFTGTAAQKQAILEQVTKAYAPFNVKVVTQRPSSGIYDMNMIGGSPYNLSMMTVGGIPPSGLAPLDCGHKMQMHISFAFAAYMQNDPALVADTVAQETAHGFGLSHVSDSNDLMWGSLPYNEHPGKVRTFQDRSMTVAGSNFNCSGAAVQNDVQLLNANIGPASCSPAPDPPMAMGSSTPPAPSATAKAGDMSQAGCSLAARTPARGNAASTMLLALGLLAAARLCWRRTTRRT